MSSSFYLVLPFLLVNQLSSLTVLTYCWKCFYSIFLSQMDCPWLFNIAFVLGLNPYSKMFPPHMFYVFGTLNILYVVLMSSYMVYNFITLKLSALLILSVVQRMCVSCYFISCELLNYDLTLNLYDKQFSELRSKENTFNSVSSFVIFLSGVLLLESVYIFRGNILEDVLFFISAFLNIVIPQTMMAQFAFCCVTISSMNSWLQKDLLQTFFPTAAYTVRRLRARQVNLSDVIRRINRAYGMKVLCYFVTVQIILIQKVDVVLSKIVQRTYDTKFGVAIITFVFQLVALWFYCFNFRRATKKVSLCWNCLLYFANLNIYLLLVSLNLE